LLEGTEFYDLDYIYNNEYNEFQKRSEFVANLEREKSELESKCALLKKNFSNEERRTEIAREVAKKIPGAVFSDIIDALRLIEKSHQINEEIMAQRAYLSKLRNYLEHVYAARKQRVADPAELDYIMKNYNQLQDDSNFKFGFDMQKIKIVISYLLQNNSSGMTP